VNRLLGRREGRLAPLLMYERRCHAKTFNSPSCCGARARYAHADSSGARHAGCRRARRDTRSRGPDLARAGQQRQSGRKKLELQRVLP
jgi:hypothetical protein